MWRMGLYRKNIILDTHIMKNEYLESDFSPNGINLSREWKIIFERFHIKFIIS